MSAGLLVAVSLLPQWGLWTLALYLCPYLLIGYDILLRAARNILHGQVFDENFLMAIATAGAFCTGEYGEGVAVMLFYQIGELFQHMAVSRSRRSIAALLDICPQTALLEKDGDLLTVSPESVSVGDVIVIKVGEKIPLDGTVIEGTSALDTAALTGESMPRTVRVGDPVASGCVNQSGVLRVRVTKPYAESTAAQIVEMVENAANRKAKAEQFITKFARIYTPAVVLSAALLALIPSIVTGDWVLWVHRALVFLVISCPCALVISVPMTFFGGIGGASREGILVKGGNYFEVLARAKTVVFDKTGTLTEGVFRVTGITPFGLAEEELLFYAAYAEAYSDHPIGRAIRQTYGQPIDKARLSDLREEAGHGVKALVDGKLVLVGNRRLLESAGISVPAMADGATAAFVSVNGTYVGFLTVSDAPKEDAAGALLELRKLGVRKAVMLTGDNRETAERIGKTIGVDDVYAELLPGDKMALVETMVKENRHGTLLFVGDGINDAPSLMRADAGIAMGVMGTDAAIEASDVVLMNDRPSAIPRAIRHARRIMGIVRQNIVLALGVKAAVLLLGAFGYAGMWAAVFADVGVAVLAILNAARALRVQK